MSLSDPDGTLKTIFAVVIIAVILVVGTSTGVVTTENGLSAIIFAIIAGIVTHSLGQAAGRGAGLVGEAFSDMTIRVLVAMVVLGALEMYALLQGIDGATMQAVVLLIASLGGYTQGTQTGYSRGVVQARGPL
jgi:hypothetical protein